MKYDFSKLRDKIAKSVQELLDNPNYQNEELKDHELSKVISKLIYLIENEDGFNDIFGSNQIIILPTMAHNISNYDITKNIILNTINFGIDDTILKLGKLFSDSEIVWGYYTLLGIKVNQVYQINDHVKLIPVSEDSGVDSKIYSATEFKNSIVNRAFSTYAALVLKDNIKIENHDYDWQPNFEENRYLEIELISLVIGLITEKGCIVFEKYSRYEQDSIMSQPEGAGLMDCKFFPNYAMEVVIDIDELLLLLNNLREFSPENLNYMKRILTMYTYACMKRNYIDSCIELRAILECIYVAGKDGKDISYTYSICERGALFLKKEKEERSKISKKLKDLYNLSSRVIHNDYKYKEGDKEKIDELRKICHNSIIQTISNKKINSKKDWEALIFE